MEIRFSIDDGHREDLRIAKILEKHGFQGIFYIAPYYGSPQIRSLKIGQIREIAKHHEIGGHTLNHKTLTNMNKPDAQKEINEGRSVLQDLTGKPVSKFAYPRGWFNDKVKRWVKQCGFDEARTMKLGVTDIRKYDKFEIPATAQLRLREEYKEAGIVHSICALFDEARERDGYFNLVMHSWEIQRYDQWRELERIIKYIKNSQ